MHSTQYWKAIFTYTFYSKTFYEYVDHALVNHPLCVIQHLANWPCPQTSCSFVVLEAVLQRLLVLISYKPHVAPLYNQVTIKPGQRLYLVNQQYPYRVKFTEDTSTPRSAADLTTPSKRPHQMIREKIKSPANPASTPHTDHHRMSDDSPPPKKTLPSESDKSVSFLWL